VVLVVGIWQVRVTAVMVLQRPPQQQLEELDGLQVTAAMWQGRVVVQLVVIVLVVRGQGVVVAAVVVVRMKVRVVVARGARIGGSPPWGGRKLSSDGKWMSI